MLHTVLVAGLIVGACANFSQFKTCDKNEQSVAAYTDAVIIANNDFEVYSGAFIEAMTYVEASTKALTEANADGWTALYAQAGTGKCVDAKVSAHAVAIAKSISAASASMTAVIAAEAEAFASAYLSVFAYSQAAAESCSCPANSDSIADSVTVATADLFVQAASEAEKVFTANVEVRDVSKAWSNAFSSCSARAKLCHRRNRFVSSVSGGCKIVVTGSGKGVDCSRVTNKKAKTMLGC